MLYHFSKYHGLGNDYLVIDPNRVGANLTQERIRLICDRNYGVGSDGILYGPHFRDGRVELQIFNPDGSEAEKSGNGLRIFARYLADEGYVKDEHFEIVTMGGNVPVDILDKQNSLIKVGMGKASFMSSEIPVTGEAREVIAESLQVGGAAYEATCVTVGNPHCVIPMQEISEAAARALGPAVENHAQFPNRINMQLLKVLDRQNIEIQIWERGAGYTLASGSSSCAAASAARKLGWVDSEITVHMPGGQLRIGISEDWELTLTGPVAGVFRGVFDFELKQTLF
ncbi:MAG: diaminopimelate epimerase [Candidatus Omnitrophica bacterium]|nr:diaminopimelate epimerase [Candidatus Omnitrophota bacterium]